MVHRGGSGRSLNAEINVTPMADIMLVLLIIFMITTPLLQNDVNVNLPKAKNPLNAKTESSIVVALTREGRIYLGKKPVSEPEFDRALSERLAAEIDKSVFLRADEAVAYGRVVDLIKECRRLGVERIGLMADKPPESAGR
jgi:biopolymer transport protein ExbD/biopolymer transport protein TolR